MWSIFRGVSLKCTFEKHFLKIMLFIYRRHWAEGIPVYQDCLIDLPNGAGGTFSSNQTVISSILTLPFELVDIL